MCSLKKRKDFKVLLRLLLHRPPTPIHPTKTCLRAQLQDSRRRFFALMKKFLLHSKSSSSSVSCAINIGHSAHKCFKRFNVDFRPTPLKSETKTVQQAMSALQIDTVGISHWLLDSGVSSHMTQP